HPLLRAQRERGNDGTLLAPLEPGGPAYLSAYRTLAEPSLVVAVSLAVNDVLADWRDERLIVGVVSGGMGLALLLAALLIAREIRARSAADARFIAADATLRTSEMRFRAIMDHAPVLVSVKDLEGRFTFVNRAFERRIGRTSADVIGKTTNDLFT